NDPQKWDSILQVVTKSPLDERSRIAYRAKLLWQALDFPTPPALNGKPTNTRQLRAELEATLRLQATFSSIPDERAWYIDQANQLRPWSLI
ncbi:MAG: hypothetical protein LBK28_04790, partial [Propionibacteriaceae bacterium]|nr:hypothetical protein [Propionibacteriaceae bacterium]